MTEDEPTLEELNEARLWALAWYCIDQFYARMAKLDDDPLSILIEVAREKRAVLLNLCKDCGINPADPPSRLCPGCEAYRAHTGQA